MAEGDSGDLENAAVRAGSASSILTGGLSVLGAAQWALVGCTSQPVIADLCIFVMPTAEVESATLDLAYLGQLAEVSDYTGRFNISAQCRIPRELHDELMLCLQVVVAAMNELSGWKVLRAVLHQTALWTCRLTGASSSVVYRKAARYLDEDLLALEPTADDDDDATPATGDDDAAPPADQGSEDAEEAASASAADKAAADDAVAAAKAAKTAAEASGDADAMTAADQALEDANANHSDYFRHEPAFESAEQPPTEAANGEDSGAHSAEDWCSEHNTESQLVEKNGDFKWLCGTHKPALGKNHSLDDWLQESSKEPKVNPGVLNLLYS